MDQQREQVPRRRRAYSFKPRPRMTEEHRKAIRALKPINPDQGTLIPKKLLVFNADDRIVLSVVSRKGTLNLPLSRKSAAAIMGMIAKALAEPVCE
jgi:hypothetical protein